jgi:hypothetical protein
MVPLWHDANYCLFVHVHIEGSVEMGQKKIPSLPYKTQKPVLGINVAKTKVKSEG